MDFITQLPQSEEGWDAIMGVVHRLTKLAYFIPTTTTVTSEQTALLFISMVFRHHGLPSEIVSDRDTRFCQNFGKLYSIIVGLN